MNFYYKRTAVKVKQEKITKALIRFAKPPPPLPPSPAPFFLPILGCLDDTDIFRL